ncbi:restriction endonuclease subunit S [Terasakiella pusilla]|uniref:restriction endonuclease subunit S n=1 Tax=Terasakiella pusilla TaxID=64973 RepID=UPI003AA7D102
MSEVLPKGWEETTIDELCTVNPKHSKETNLETQVSFIPMPAVCAITGTIKQHVDRPLSEVWKGYTHFAENDVIFAKITPCMENGKAAIANGLTNGLACGSTEFYVLRSNGAVLPKYLHLYVRQQGFRDEAKRNMSGAVGQQRVPKTYLQEQELPVPPLNEQHRIVEKIDALMARSGAAKEALDAIPKLLDQYRQSVLAAAFRGDLTKDWRKKNPNVEPAETLLERIRKERRHRWEETELAKLRAKGKEPKDDKWKAKYKEPTDADWDVSLPLPNNWAWSSVELLGAMDEQAVLTGPFGADLGRKDFISEGVPVLTIGCLQERGVILDKAEHVSEQKSLELSRYRVQKNDLLFSRMASVGRVGYVTDQLSGLLINYHIIRLRLNDQALHPEFYMYYVRGALTVKKYLDKINHGMTRDGVNSKQILLMPVSLPPIEEQLEIIRRIKFYEQMIHTVEDHLAVSRNSLNKLNQSILAKAFRGELVSQDPTDEPAAALLNRIRKERIAQAPAKKRGRKKTE